jgi:FkbM family methyltransferase
MTNQEPSMAAFSAVTGPFRRLAAREDFRRNPAKALVKRMAWRLRWAATSNPMHLRHAAGFSLAAPKGAAGALIYYVGSSEPESAAFLTRFLKPGMIFFDAGAHIGEYVLLAASCIGDRGQVHAFEAQPATAVLLRQNCAANLLRNVVVNSCALSDREGQVDFDICPEPAMSSIATRDPTGPKPLTRIRVRSMTLDAYCAQKRVWPDLVKIDVEGAEWLVLQGALQMLSRPAPIAPAVVFECLASTYERFGASPSQVIEFLQQLGYRIHRITRQGELIPHAAPLAEESGRNLVALKL